MKTEIQVEVELMGPETARELLSKNFRNRPLREKRIKKLAEAIKRGEWVLNGETVKIADSGCLIDGQHRLEAIVRSKTIVPVLVVRGLPESVMSTIDVGAVRSAGDALGILGDARGRSVAGVAKWVWRIEKGPKWIRSMETPTIDQVLKVVRDHQHIQRGARLAGVKDLRTSVGHAGMLGALYAIVGDEYGAECEEFLEQLGSGLGFQSDSDPVLRLRSTMMGWKSRRKKAPYWQVWTVVVKAWNAYLDGQEIRLLAAKDGEIIPAPRGADVPTRRTHLRRVQS